MLDKNNIATEAGTVTVYNYDATTREYTGSSDEFLAVGVGIPAHSAIDKPPAQKNSLAVLRTTDGSGWELVDDHRGEMVYSTETGAEMAVTQPGNLPGNTTTQAPATPYDKWNGKKWVTDTDAEHAAAVTAANAEKKARIDAANDYMNDRQWPGKAALGRLKDEEKAQYILWLDYLDALEAVDTSSAPDINWPDSPEV